MKKLAVLSTTALIGFGSIAASTTDAEARWRGHRGGGAVAAGVIGGLAAGALIGAAASNAYAYPSYGYGYEQVPAYGYGYAPVGYRGAVRAYSYEPAYGYDYAPAYRTRVVRARYAPVYRERVVRSYGYAPRQRLARSYGPEHHGYAPAYYGGGYGGGYYGGPRVSVGFGSGGYWR